VAFAFEVAATAGRSAPHRSPVDKHRKTSSNFSINLNWGEQADALIEFAVGAMT